MMNEQYYPILIENMSPILSKEICQNAVSFLANEHNLDKLIQLKRMPGKKGIFAKFNRKGTILTASMTKKKQEITYDCDCSIGKSQGFCFHVGACFISLFRRNAVILKEFPFIISKTHFDACMAALQKVEAQKLYSSEPDILISNNYKIYDESDFIRIEWGGEFAGKKKVSNFSPYSTSQEWIASKVVDILLKPIKKKQKVGQPYKILVDRINVITKISESPKLLLKILNKCEGLPDLPQNEEDIFLWLKSDLGNMAKLKSELKKDVDIPPFEAYNGSEPYIFVSYAHADKLDVYPIIERLHREGFKVWFDHGIPSGLDWADYIATRLMNCAIFLSFISDNAIQSTNTIDEIEFALNENRPYFGIYLHETNLSPGMKMRLRRIQGIQKYQLDESEFYNKLLGSLKKMI
ncbi:toll/interleukin-1 receptor domain-containing protein [Candidatus Lokiarchaeum ossiferum]|uniref:toll/interleukin-1 receptor domain-containing protein n=1 Tax=Candidatus Lokiarchaeum ossiferum TaxID=2951803 RepID=UPI00352D53C9